MAIYFMMGKKRAVTILGLFHLLLFYCFLLFFIIVVVVVAWYIARVIWHIEFKSLNRIDQSYCTQAWNEAKLMS
jgi:hypothetical protein